MIFFAVCLLLVSLASVMGLFTLKRYEEQRGIVLAPQMRHSADEKAIEFKNFLLSLRSRTEQLPPLGIRIVRIIIHDLALSFAMFARAAEKQAHRLADLVSHKHRFERRETKSEFLKQVSEYKTDAGELDSSK